MRFVICLALVLSTASSAFAQDTLDESKTFVVIAGVLQWPEGRLGSFPTKNRKDEELYETLKARGVPENQMKLLLDDDATYSKIRGAIRDIAGKAPKDATFIFYYCGHGMPAEGDDVCLANYDLDPKQPKRTGLLVSDSTKLIEKHFRGKRVLLLADCCFSGGLAKSARDLHKAGYEAASLTSATDSVTSTRNWTFTQTIIDGLNGDSFGDANSDGSLTLGELAGDVKAAMESLENQPAGVAVENWPKDMKLASAKLKPSKTEGPFRAGDYVMAPSEGAARVGRVIAVGTTESTVEFYDYSDKTQVKIANDKIQSLASYKASKGKLETATHEVEWRGNWYKASIIRRDGKKTQIHYVGYGSEWDEWVTPERIRPIPFDGQ
jgi:hypothetical protein